MARDAELEHGRRSQKGQPAARWLSRRSRRWAALGFALVVAAVGTGFWWWTSRPGETAPAFALPASTGETVRLEDYRGKQPVVLVF